MAKYIAAGYSVDAEKLLSEFVQLNSIEFPSFAELWKKRGFVAVYMGRDKNEIEPFTNEIFQITLGFLQNGTFLFQVGTIFLLYALYRNQLCVPLVKIRVTLPQFKIFKKIRTAAIENHYRTLHYVTDYLSSNSFEYVALSTQYGPKAPRTTVDYGNSTFASLSKNLKSEVTQFSDSKILESLRDKDEKYSNLRRKIFPQDTRNMIDYEKHIRELKNLVSDDSMSFTEHKGTSSKTESSISSRGAEIKAASFSKKASFRQLNDSDDEDYEKNKQKEENLQAVGLPKITGERGRKKRMTFLEECDIMPTLSSMKESELEDGDFEEIDSNSSYSEEGEKFF